MKMGLPVNRTSGDRETPGDAPREKGPTRLQRDSAGRRGEASGPFGVRRRGLVPTMTARGRLESGAPLSTSPRAGLSLIYSFGPRRFSDSVKAALPESNQSTRPERRLSRPPHAVKKRFHLLDQRPRPGVDERLGHGLFFRGLVVVGEAVGGLFHGGSYARRAFGRKATPQQKILSAPFAPSLPKSRRVTGEFFLTLSEEGRI